MVTSSVRVSRRLREPLSGYSGIREARITSEKAFSDLWERSLDLHPELIGRDGESYEVLFPGVRNQGAGPDFKGAVLRRDGKKIGGDIELHLDPSGWRAHGHHGDSRYRGVVLQVVLKARQGRSGTEMPPTAEARFDTTRSRPLSLKSPLEVPDIEELGVKRFLAKSAGFMLEIETATSSDQVVYESLLDAMGYARNRRPFRSLARQVPYNSFLSLNEEPTSTREFAVFSALVVGGALVEDLDQIERLQVRRIARQMGVKRCLSPKSWNRFRVRPTNAPASRVRGVASLIARSTRTGLVNSLEAVFEREGVRGLIREVENRPHIGRGFAVTVVANVVVPALHAFYLSQNAGEHQRIEEAFREMPSPPQDEVTRGISSVLGLEARPRLATQHFGLHALARSSSWPGSGASAA